MKEGTGEFDEEVIVKDVGYDGDFSAFDGAIVPNTVIEKLDVKRWSWETRPAPFPEDQISETIEADAIIVGGGISGLATAARATELGLHVIVIEKSGGFVGRGGEISTVGSSVQRANGVYIDKQKFAIEWMRVSGSRVNEDLLWLFINRSEEAIEWLLEIGGSDVYCELFSGFYQGQDYTEYPGAHHIYKKPGCKRWKYTGALMYCEMLYEVAVNGGSRVIRNTQGMQLEKENDRVVSVIAKHKSGEIIRYKGKCGVVLATGDISGDVEMLEAFSPWGLLSKKSSAGFPGSNLGEGHKMGYWVGGKFETAPWALSMHMTGYASFLNFFLCVNARGNRFMNEDTWWGGQSVRVLMQPGGDYAFTIFDAKWYDDAARTAHHRTGGGGMAAYGAPWDNESNRTRQSLEKYIEKGYAWRAGSIEELAEMIHVPAEALVTAVTRYNEIYHIGSDIDYGKQPGLLTSIIEPPFYAVKYGPALLNVFGGLETDVKLRVLNDNRDPIDGLLAVGMIAGGLYGIDYPMLMPGNSIGRCITWGRVAAETLVEDIEKKHF